MSVIKTKSKKLNMQFDSIGLRDDGFEAERGMGGLVTNEDRALGDSLVESTDPDAETDEIGLDDEDLNPFGDKWEV